MKKPYIKYFLSAAVILLASCAAELTPEEHLGRAREFLQAQEYKSATIELKNAALKAPQNADVRYELALIAIIMGDGYTAEKEARYAMEMGIPPEKVALLIVQALYLQGNFEQVLIESKQIPVRLEPAVMADIMAYRAQAFMQQQKYKLADAAVEQAIGYKPDSTLAVLAKASYEAQVGRSETAMTLAEKAVELDPTSADAWALLGDLHAASGELEKAKTAYTKALSNRKYVSMTLARRALTLAQLDEYEQARGDIGRLSTTDLKRHPYVNFVSGYIAFRQKDYEAAAVALDRSIAADSNNPVTKFYLVASYMELGKLEQAREVADQLYATIPNSVEVARMFASLNIQQQDFGAARDSLNGLLETEEDPVALGMLGAIALMQGNGEEALGYLQRRLAVTPEDESVQKMIDLAMTMRGDFVSEVSAAAEHVVAEEDFERVLLSAGVALKEGQLKEAVVIAENLQQQYPARVGPLNMLAAIYLSVGDWREGKQLLEQALAIDPKDPSAIKSLAKIQLRTGEEELAGQQMTVFLKDNPEDLEAIGVLCEAIVTTKSYQEAEKQLIELLDRHPKNLEVRAYLTRLYFDNGAYQQVSVRTEGLSDEDMLAQPALVELRGKALFGLGDAASAARLWKQWVELAPGSVLANFYYADSLAKSKNFTQALEHLKICRELNPQYVPARISTIRVTAQSGDPENAAAEMAKLRSELKEERADVWYTQGWLHANSGNYAEAELALKKSLSLQPTPDTAVLLFATLNGLGRPEDAQASLEGWLEKFPKNITLMAVLGQNYLARKENPKAVAIYQRILQLEPQSVLALNNLAWLTKDKDLDKAFEYANKASDLAPDDPYVMSTLASLHVAGGQVQEGEQLMRKAALKYPDNLQLKLDLGRLLLEQGNEKAARAYLEEVIAGGGNPGLAAAARALLEAGKGG